MRQTTRKIEGKNSALWHTFHLIPGILLANGKTEEKDDVSVVIQ